MQRNGRYSGQRKTMWKGTEVGKSRMCSGDGGQCGVDGRQVEPKLTRFDGDLDAHHSIWSGQWSLTDH